MKNLKLFKVKTGFSLDYYFCSEEESILMVRTDLKDHLPNHLFSKESGNSFKLPKTEKIEKDCENIPENIFKVSLVEFVFSSERKKVLDKDLSEYLFVNKKDFKYLKAIKKYLKDVYGE